MRSGSYIFLLNFIYKIQFYYNHFVCWKIFLNRSSSFNSSLLWFGMFLLWNLLGAIIVFMYVYVYRSYCYFVKFYLTFDSIALFICYLSLSSYSFFSKSSKKFLLIFSLFFSYLLQSDINKSIEFFYLVRDNFFFILKDGKELLVALLAVALKTLLGMELNLVVWYGSFRLMFFFSLM